MRALISYPLPFLLVTLTLCVVMNTAVFATEATPQNETTPRNLDSSACIHQRVMQDIEPNSSHQLESDTLEYMLNCAAEAKETLLELFDDLIVSLNTINARASISGSTMRELSNTFFYGGRRMIHLFPISVVQKIDLGAPLAKAPQLAITLKETPPVLIEKVNWVGKVHSSLDLYYGCNVVRLNEYTECFGMTAETALFKSTVTRISIYDKNLIAIYVQNLFRPKRWHINPIVRHAN